MITCIPSEVADAILNFLWDDIVIELDTAFYLSLALTSKTFKTTIYRRRKSLMLAQASHFRLATSLPGRILKRKDPLSNPYVCLIGTLLHMMTGPAPLAVLPAINAFLDKHREMIDALCFCTGPPSMYVSPNPMDTLAASRRSRSVTFGDDGRLFLLKDVAAVRAKKQWPYGIFKRMGTGKDKVLIMWDPAVGPSAYTIQQHFHPV
ncbi:hypothetical protein DFJ77DRAFT_507635 [Powellomyces hirtus]|nr:hypothetical protein DFJ77DRAFT_507635 [Powellomyces hirtus]